METFLHIWNYQLLVTDGQPITLGKVIIALTLIIFGFFAARFLSHRIGRRIIERIRVDMAMKYTLERVFFYAIYLFIILVVLQILNIPLTAFAFVGGALAIGIGFGSQNIVNNFISGLIVMFTQPLRVSDWVEVEGVFGEVQNIGSRSTVLLTADNKQVVIPNSFFLEKSFINWTLSDRSVSSALRIGVAYGTDPNLVKDVLLEVARQCDGVLKDPPSSVFFQDFGASSLDFDLFYWVDLKREKNHRAVASDLRFLIDAEFKKRGIEIPFPHRQLLIKPDQRVHIQMDNANG